MIGAETCRQGAVEGQSRFPGGEGRGICVGLEHRAGDACSGVEGRQVGGSEGAQRVTDSCARWIGEGRPWVHESQFADDYRYYPS